MKRLLVFALMATVGQASAAFAEDSLLASGARHTQPIARADGGGPTTTPSRRQTTPAVSIARHEAPALQVGQAGLARRSIRTRTKWMIALGLGAGFAAGAWTIDHHVLDVTPSSLGTRQD